MSSVAVYSSRSRATERTRNIRNDMNRASAYIMQNDYSTPSSYSSNQTYKTPSTPTVKRRTRDSSLGTLGRPNRDSSMTRTSTYTRDSSMPRYKVCKFKHFDFVRHFFISSKYLAGYIIRKVSNKVPTNGFRNFLILLRL